MYFTQFFPSVAIVIYISWQIKKRRKKPWQKNTMKEYDIKTNNTMVIRTLTMVSPMTENQNQEETTIQGMKVSMNFPDTSSSNTSINEIKDLLLEIFKQNISKDLFINQNAKENDYE